MVWARIDDAWWSHRKTLETSLAARGLWATALSWAGHQRTDEIPRRFLAIAGATEDLAHELVEVGLWETTEKGWRIHDWRQYQDLSAIRAEAGRKGGKRSAEVRRARDDDDEANDQATGQANGKQKTPSDQHEQPTDGEANGEANTQANGQAGTRPGPARPDPTRPNPTRAPAGSDFPAPPADVDHSAGGEGQIEQQTRRLAGWLKLTLKRRLPDDLTANLARCLDGGWTLAQLRKELEAERPETIGAPTPWLAGRLGDLASRQSPQRARERADAKVVEQQAAWADQDRRLAESGDRMDAAQRLVDSLGPDQRAELEAKALAAHANPKLVPKTTLMLEVADLARQAS